MSTFPLLYKRTKTGAIQTYQVSTSDNIITVTQGQLGGKLQSYTTTCSPKNVGKSNETSPSQQADLEAASKHQSKLDAGYTTDPSGEILIQLPMKVKVYQDQLKNVQFPCYVQPKLNGVNATYTLTNDQLILTSRGGEVYPPIPHLESNVRWLLKHHNTDRIAGELYMHGYHLQDITSFVRAPKPESKDLQFHIFDFPNVNLPYAQRRALMDSYKFPGSRDFYMIPATLCATHSDIDNQFDKWTAMGYEGVVIYNPNGMYQYNTRSSDVFKYKKAQDAEFRITNYSIDKSGHPILECTTPEGRPFNVKPKGTSAERLAVLSNINDYIGQWYTVEFETYSKDLIPLKPCGVGLRKCSPSGAPLE